MSDFNPTNKDLLLIDTLIIDIKKKKSGFIQSKIRLQNSLSQLKAKYKDVDQGSKDFNKIKNTRENIKNHLAGLELKIKSLNDELAYKNKLRLEIEFHIKHHKQLESKEDVDKITIKLNALKIKYNNFAKDKTRIASLRIMACEFVDELNELL